MTGSRLRRWTAGVAAAITVVMLVGCSKPEDKPQPPTTSQSVEPSSKAVQGGPNNFSPKPLPPLPTVPNETDTKPGA